MFERGNQKYLPIHFSKLYNLKLCNFTGYILKFVAHQQIRYKPGSTITKLALNIGHVMVPRNIPKDFHFDDQGYFAMEEEENDKDMSKNYGLTMN